MAWHIFERLLEEVANQSNHFIGKIWITALFMFRLITVASIGDTIYHDEQSAFKCNTQQPGCENVCFNHFSPISQIRFYAFQILMVGTPSIVYIIFAVHKRNKIPPTCLNGGDDSHDDHKEEKKKSNRTEDEEEIKKNSYEININNLPNYDDIITENGGKLPKDQKLGSRLSQFYVNSYNQEQNKSLMSSFGKETSSSNLKKRKITKNKTGKVGVKRKPVFKHDFRSEIVTTPAIRRAYFFQVFIRTAVEAAFLYLQYVLYDFEVKELYICEGFPCPRVVECFVSRPMEKTLFLLFMYAMTGLSLFLNLFEMAYFIWRGIKKNFLESSKPKKSTTYHHPAYEIIERRRARDLRQYEGPRGFPKLGPHRRTHSDSFGGDSDNGTIDSEYYFIDRH